jgi:hypothetical protein
MVKNQQFGPPENEKTNGLILDYNFTENRLPVFWGPDQVIREDGIYHKPTGWVDNRPLIIPKVARFIYDKVEGQCTSAWAKTVKASSAVGLPDFNIGGPTQPYIAVMRHFTFNWPINTSTGLKMTPNRFYAGEKWRLVCNKQTIGPGFSIILDEYDVMDQGVIDSDGRFIGVSSTMVPNPNPLLADAFPMIQQMEFESLTIVPELDYRPGLIAFYSTAVGGSPYPESSWQPVNTHRANTVIQVSCKGKFPSITASIFGTPTLPPELKLPPEEDDG